MSAFEKIDKKRALKVRIFVDSTSESENFDDVDYVEERVAKRRRRPSRIPSSSSLDTFENDEKKKNCAIKVQTFIDSSSESESESENCNEHFVDKDYVEKRVAKKRICDRIRGKTGGS